MTQPSSQHSPSPPPANGSQQPRGRRRYNRPLFWIVVFGFFLAYGVVQVPREMGRRHLVSAYQLWDSGEAESAFQELNAAARWFPNSPELLLQRAEWKLEDGEKQEALADCDAMLSAGKESYLWLSVHASFLQHAGEFAGAVDDWKKIAQFSERSGIPARATALNGLAYAQALAKVEVDEALGNVNEALDLERTSPSILDTRGYIHFLHRDYEEALKDLDLAVAGFDKAVERADARAQKNSMPPLYRKVVRSRPKRLLEIAPADEQSERDSIALGAAVVHYHRSLVLNALDRKDEARQDSEIARQLCGREPDQTLF